jgi:CRISPR/Cas system CSM-associated protein Csm3 (group 7 of RAMP superfamily)
LIITVMLAVIDVDAGWAVGAADAGSATIDRELLVDRDGNPWVPASTLAGSLRAHLARNGADERLMGSRPPGQPTEEPLNPSSLWLLGTRTHANGAAPQTEVVASTAIDPRRRAARPQSLRYSRQVGDACQIKLYALHEGAVGNADWRILASWRPAIGRDRTRGGGTAKLTRLAYRAYDLDDAQQLRQWLNTAGYDRFTGLTDVTIPAAADDTVLQATFELADPLHIATGSRHNSTSLTRTRNGRPLLPATAWKGLFRARTGYIIRTRLGDNAACTTQTGCGDCPLCDLFGSAGRRGRLAFRDSTVNNPEHAERAHVAIDRVSGGARDKLLFTQQVIMSGQLTLTINGLDQIDHWEHNMLLHVVRDLDDGLIGVGGGAQRGQGTLRLTAGSRAVLDDLQPVTPPTEPPT